MLRLYDKPNSNFQANSQVPSQSPHRIVFIGFLNLLGLKSGRFLGNQPKTVLFFFCLLFCFIQSFFLYPSVFSFLFLVVGQFNCRLPVIVSSSFKVQLSSSDISQSNPEIRLPGNKLQVNNSRMNANPSQSSRSLSCQFRS